MGVSLDFKNNQMAFMNHQANMQVNDAGQLLVNILDYPARPERSSAKCEARSHTAAGVNKDNCGDNENHQNGDRHKTKITLKKKECRCLLAQMSQSEVGQVSQGSCVVAELFSPPRFCHEAQKHGYHGVAYDDPKVQDQVDKELDQLRPNLLIACPPCTHRGGWEHLSRCYRSPVETARLLRRSRAQVRFCIRQLRKQKARGGEFMFEHPWGAETWEDEEMIPMKRKYGVRRVDMCAYGLRCPDTKLPIRKATGLMLSRRPEDRGMKLHTCSGCPEHRVVEGKLLDGRNVSEFVAQYTTKFVQEMMDLCVGDRLPNDAVPAHLAECEDWECLASESVDAPEPEASHLPRLNLSHLHPSQQRFRQQ